VKLAMSELSLPTLRRAVSLTCVLSLSACTSAYDKLGADAGNGQRPGAPALTTDIEVRTAGPVGWAAVDALGQNGTTGGGTATPTVVTTIEAFTAAVTGATPGVVQIGASMEGSVKIGSNKTVTGAAGVVFTGHLGIDSAVNVIVRDLKLVGYNCTDNAVCEGGADALTISDAAHHVWVDHCDVSNGSDGNLDINHASDYVTISWTKFSYVGARVGGHQFSNLIGSSDTDTGDVGHLKVTWHHDWWADGVVERMPRMRYGQVHLFNNLYTSVGNSYCIGVGWNANVLLEDNVFTAVKDPVTTKFRNDATIVMSYGNLYESGSLSAPNLGTQAFEPPYEYVLQPAEVVRDTVSINAGPSVQ
jgi:pectate lyase